MIAAYGVSGSGKTTVIEYLISMLTKEGYKVGAIKHIHRENFTVDKEGSNTWRFTKAGSKVTVAVSPEEIATIKKTKTSFEDLDGIIEQLKNEQLDVVFIEGFKSAVSKRHDTIKIVTAKTPDDLASALKVVAAPIVAITGLIAKNKPAKSEIPIFDLPAEGPQLLGVIKKYLIRK